MKFTSVVSQDVEWSNSLSKDMKVATEFKVKGII